MRIDNPVGIDAQLTGSFSGSFYGNFFGDGSQVVNVQSASFSVTASYVDLTFDNLPGIPSNLISSSAQIAGDISGSWAPFSASTAIQFLNIESDSGSFSSRITNLQQFSSSLNDVYATDQELAQATASLNAAITVVSSSVVDLKLFSSSLNDVYATDLELNTATASLSAAITVVSSSVVDLKLFSSSLNDIYATDLELGIATASLSASIALLSSSFEVVSGSYASFIKTYNTGSFTGSFIGDGSEVFGVVSSSYSMTSSYSMEVEYSNITGVPDGIISSSVQLSNTTIPGNLTIGGTLTAEQFYTEYVTSSVIYKSGSTKLGDSLDDIHQVTGSNKISGSLDIYGAVGFEAGLPVGPGVWTAVAALTSGREGVAGAGTQKAALAFGGKPSGVLTCTEAYNGTSWTVGGALITGRHTLGGAGTQTAALAFGGSCIAIANEAVSCTENYDGSVWSAASAALNITRFGLGGVGTQNAALAFAGGRANPGGGFITSGWTEEYNGTSWSTSNNLLNLTFLPAGAGTQNAALAFGCSSSTLSYTEKYNGTSWSAGPAMNTTRDTLAGSGTQNAAVAFGGRSSGGGVSCTEEFNGTSWSSANPLITGRLYLGGAGESRASLAFGGQPALTCTEEYNPAIVPVKTFKFSSTTGDIAATGSLSGNATTATSASYADTTSFAVSASYVATSSFAETSKVSTSSSYSNQSRTVYVTGDSSNVSYEMLFNYDNIEDGYTRLGMDSGAGFTYNPSTNTLTVDNVDGTAATASYVSFTNIANKPTLLSSSAQIADEISGSFTSTSESIALDIADLVSDSGSFSIRVSSLELFSSSLNATYATDKELAQATASLSASIANISSSFLLFSGSYVVDSGSINSRLLNNSSSIATLSGSFLAFSSSYNSGSFTGSFKGILEGTSSYAVTASYVKFNNVGGIHAYTSSVSSSIAYLSSSFLIFSSSYNTGSFTGSFNGEFTGSYTGSFVGDGSRLTGVTAVSAQNTIITVKNLSGATFAKGTPLYLTDSGNSGNMAGAYPADAGNPARMPAGAIAGESIAPGNEGIGLVNGFIQGVNTTGFTSGAEVFVAVGGGYTQTAPTGSALVQKLGNIEKVGNNGSGVINGPGTVRSVPNVTPGHVFVGGNNHVPITVSTASFHTGSFTGSFIGNGSQVVGVVSASYSLTSSYALGVEYNKIINLPSGILSSSAQIADEISGSFTSVSSSIALEITGLISDSGSFSTRVTNLENFSSSLNATYATDQELRLATASLSSSIAQISSSFLLFSGSHVTESGSFAQRITNNSASISILSSSFVAFSGSYITDSGSFGSRITANSSSIATLSGSFLLFSASYNSGSFSGSFQGDGSRLTNLTIVHKYTGSANTAIIPLSGSNQSTGEYASILGGTNNIANGTCSTIGGGAFSTANGEISTIGGGFCNTTSGNYSTISGGQRNVASTNFATVSGGSWNTASGYSSTVSGGGGGGGVFQNIASNCFTTVGGGGSNTASGLCSTVGGGFTNIASGTASTISGGYNSRACGNFSTVGGGTNNVSSTNYSTIGGGINNTSNSVCSTISGGRGNTISTTGACSFIGGGVNNQAQGLASTVAGGCGNIASGACSGILGGKLNNTCGFADSFIVGSNVCATAACYTFMNNTCTLGTTRTTSLVETSARKHKEDITPLDSQLGKVAQLNPVEFTWKNTGLRDTGLIAEEVDVVYPQLVSREDNGELHGVHYSKLTAILIKAVQEQQKQIEELRTEVEKLKRIN